MTLKEKILFNLKRYEKVKSDLIDFDSLFYDAITFDIEGYYFCLEEQDVEDLRILENKVRNFEILVQCLKYQEKLSFKYC